MIRHDVSMPELNSEQKIAFFLEAVSVESAIAVVLSPQFFDVAKAWPNIVLTMSEESSGKKPPNKIIDEAIDLLYKYEGVTAYEEEVARIYGIPIFVKPICCAFQVYHNQQEIVACLSYK